MHDDKKHHTLLCIDLYGTTNRKLRELTAELLNMLELGAEDGDYAERWELTASIDLDGKQEEYTDADFDRVFGDPEEAEFADFLQEAGLQ